ncbi:hypothetical protein [Pseudonocardia lacus]|uniref:hypothetical protein n=1 Tax=Pseudonocardia lacus TaxID=2835865 RepID=UPI001BDCA9EE|nr:hypothetical protein [Pseudonocardia lacus]
MDADGRDAVIADLFRALEDLMGRYPGSRAADADRITGELARHLALARGRLRALPTGEPEPDTPPASALPRTDRAGAHLAPVPGPRPTPEAGRGAPAAAVERIGHRATRRLRLVQDPPAPRP